MIWRKEGKGKDYKAGGNSRLKAENSRMKAEG
jgi:hypothetical protein